MANRGAGSLCPEQLGTISKQADPSQANEGLHHGLPERSFLFAGAAEMMIGDPGLPGAWPTESLLDRERGGTWPETPFGALNQAVPEADTPLNISLARIHKSLLLLKLV